MIFTTIFFFFCFCCCLFSYSLIHCWQHWITLFLCLLLCLHRRFFFCFALLCYTRNFFSAKYFVFFVLFWLLFFWNCHCLTQYSMLSKVVELYFFFCFLFIKSRKFVVYEQSDIKEYFGVFSNDLLHCRFSNQTISVCTYVCECML